MSYKTDKLEQKAVSFLKENITNSDIEFIGHGGSDSTKSDIEVLYKEKEIFWVSVKSSLSQGGQITVEKNGMKYVCTSKKFVKEEPLTHRIIDNLNAHPKYASPSTRGDFFDDDDLILNWYKAISAKKREKFVIYPIKINGLSNFAIVPIDNINLFFDIRGAWRIKQSGSSHTNESNHEKYKNLANEHLESLCIVVNRTQLYKVKKKKAVELHFYFDLEEPLPPSKWADERYFSDKGYLGKDVYSNNPHICYLKTRDIKPDPNPNIIVEMYAKDLVLSEIDVLNLLNNFKNTLGI